MKDTIKAKECYWIGKNPEIKKEYGENARVLMDGQKAVMLCYLRSLEDFQDERRQNECFIHLETFTTRNGNRYHYWRDEELDEDYITKFETVQDRKESEAV